MLLVLYSEILNLILYTSIYFYNTYRFVMSVMQKINFTIHYSYYTCGRQRQQISVCSLVHLIPLKIPERFPDLGKQYLVINIGF